MEADLPVDAVDVVGVVRASFFVVVRASFSIVVCASFLIVQKFAFGFGPSCCFCLRDGVLPRCVGEFESDWAQFVVLRASGAAVKDRSRPFSFPLPDL
jgi:hypothetical protein